MREPFTVVQLCMIKGIISGSFLSASIFSGFDIHTKVFLFFIGMVVFIENVFSFGHDPHIISFLVSNFFGFVIAIAFFPVLLIYLIVLLIIVAVIYWLKFFQ